MNIYADPLGDDSWAATEQSPVKTLNRFVQKVNEAGLGTTGILSGTFIGQGISGLIGGTSYDPRSLVRITSKPGQRAQLTAGGGLGAGIGPAGGKFIQFDSLDISNRGYSIQNAFYIANCHDIRVWFCTAFDGGAGNGIMLLAHSGGIFYNIDVSDSEFAYPNQQGLDRGSASHGVYASSGHGIESLAAVGVDLNVIFRRLNIHHCNGRTPDHLDPSYVSPYVSRSYGGHVFGGGENNQLNGITWESCDFHDNSNGLILGWGQIPGSLAALNSRFRNNALRGMSLENCAKPRVFHGEFDGFISGIDVGAMAYVNDADIQSNIFKNGRFSMYVNGTNGATWATFTGNDDFTQSGPQDDNKRSVIANNRYNPADPPLIPTPGPIAEVIPDPLPDPVPVEEEVFYLPVEENGALITMPPPVRRLSDPEFVQFTTDVDIPLLGFPPWGGVVKWKGKDVLVFAGPGGLFLTDITAILPSIEIAPPWEYSALDQYWWWHVPEETMARIAEVSDSIINTTSWAFDNKMLLMGLGLGLLAWKVLK